MTRYRRSWIYQYISQINIKMSLIIRKDSYGLLYLFASIILIAYVSYRAYALSFTCDEGLSFTIVQWEPRWILSANNHPLNTILMMISNTLFGSSELALRLPNILSFILFLAGCFGLLEMAKNNWLALLGFSLCVLNPFVIEFFSLARGYGMSLGFLMMSLYYMMKDEGMGGGYLAFRKTFIFSVLFATIAATAHLLLINYLICVIIIFAIRYYIHYKESVDYVNHHKDFVRVVIMSCVPLVIGIGVLVVLMRANELYFGAASFTGGFEMLIKNSDVFAWHYIDRYKKKISWSIFL